MGLESQVGKQIKTARESRGWTQEKLAKKLGITAAYISRLEKNGALPSDELAKKLARVLSLNERGFRKKILEQRTSIDIEKDLLPLEGAPVSELNDEEKEVIGIFQKLSERAKRVVKEILRSFKDQAL